MATKKKNKQNLKDIEIEDLKQSLHGLQQMVLGAFRKEEIFDYLVQDFEFEIEYLDDHIDIETEDPCISTKELNLLKKDKSEWAKHLAALKKIRASKLFKKEG